MRVQSIDPSRLDKPGDDSADETKLLLAEIAFGGADGSEVVVRFLEDAWRFLAPGGRIYIILSSFGSIRTVLRTAKERYEVEMVEERHMFFESILAYRMTAKTSRA